MWTDSNDLKFFTYYRDNGSSMRKCFTPNLILRYFCFWWFIEHHIYRKYKWPVLWPVAYAVGMWLSDAKRYPVQIQVKLIGHETFIWRPGYHSEIFIQFRLWIGWVVPFYTIIIAPFRSSLCIYLKFKGMNIDIQMWYFLSSTV